MKRILALLTVFFIGAPAGLMSMETPTKSPITYSNPFRTTNHFKICAYHNGIKIGSVKYRKEENKYWYLAKLTVDKKHRKTDNKVGYNLFSKCLTHIQTQKPTRVHWFVTCIKDDSPSLATLTAIYKRMVVKLKIDKHLIVEPYETMTFMALHFTKEATI